MFEFLTLLLAQAAEAVPAAKSQSHMWMALGLFLVATVPTYFAGVALARSLRMPDYGGKLGLIFMSLGLGITVLIFGTPKFGIDLKGGVIYVYEMDTAQNATDEQGNQITVEKLVAVLSNRLNPGGVSEIQIRPYGENQVEIVIPDVSAEESEAIKRKIENAGMLEFLIVATDPQRDDAINIVLNDPTQAREKFIRNKQGKVVGKWVRDPWEEVKGGEKQLAVFYPTAHYRDAITLQLLPEARSMGQAQFQAYLKEQGIEQVDILMNVDPDRKVEGGDLANARVSTNEVGNYIVQFTMKADGAIRMGQLTGENISEPNRRYFRYLGIVLDNNLRSAPSVNSMISDSGQISGNFKLSEVKFLVDTLRSGSLPASLQREPISENQISALLGQDTINKGAFAIVVSILAVLVFMLFYYRFAGLVACIALVINMVLVVSAMILMKAAFTLPGLAGMVLTVGMSVDANVLIFERIREELERGAALRMAIRNGFARAMSTIIDSNVTTLITAIVLYVIGTEQLKGFAVTLILGILMSMYTAIFVSRVIFDIAERRRFITKLNMMNLWGKSQIDFVKLQVPASILSLVLIVVGIGATVTRGKDMFDIDFNGGTSVDLMLLEPMTVPEVRKRLDAKFDNEVQWDLHAINAVAGHKDGTLYQVVTSLTDEQELQRQLAEIFSDNGKSLLATNSLSLVAAVKPVEPFGPAAFAVPRTPANAPLNNKAEAEPSTPPPSNKSAEKKPAEVTPPAETKPAEEKPAEAKPEEAKGKEEKPAVEEPSAATEKGAEKATEESPAENAPTTPAVEPPTDSPDATPKPSEDAAPSDAEPSDTTPKGGEPDGEPATEEPKSTEGESAFRTDVPRDLLAFAFQDEAAPAPAPPATAPDEPKPEEPKTEEPKTEEPKAEEPKPEPAPVETPATEPMLPDAVEPPTTTEPTTTEPAAPKVPQVFSGLTAEFQYDINAPTLTMLITNAVRKLSAAGELERKYWDTESANPNWLQLQPIPSVAGWTPESSLNRHEWSIKFVASTGDTQKIIDEVKREMADTIVWTSSSKIGGKVAGKTRNQAAWAVFASLLGIIGYVWFRFQKLAFGLAAVVALLHDVLITVGFIALSSWLAGIFGFLLIEEFKISLTVIAAILTLIGYSLNDTIVIFDRIREVKGKSPQLTGEIINQSINQTLSRTFLTAGTTLIVVVILYAMGGAGIHGFAFSMLIGIVVGTYSSVFIAAPMLLWMATRANTAPARKPSKVA
jgi:SecD/SecF fusion protein